MGVPTSEVGYTIATTRRETTKVRKNMWWHWKEEERKKKIKTNEIHYFSSFFLIKNSTCFGQIYCPTSGVSTLYTQQ
jgi:hypothetical protein